MIWYTYETPLLSSRLLIKGDIIWVIWLRRRRGGGGCRTQNVDLQSDVYKSISTRLVTVTFIIEVNNLVSL